jgi:hypothetical protein
MVNESFELVLGCADTLEPFAKFVIVVHSLGTVRDCVLHCSTSPSRLLAPSGILRGMGGFVNRQRTVSFVGKMDYVCQTGTYTTWILNGQRKASSAWCDPERTRSQGRNLTSHRPVVQNSGTRGCGPGFVSSMPPFGRFDGWPGSRAQDAAYPGSDCAARAPLFGEINVSKCWNIPSTLAGGFNNGIGFVGA